MKKLLIAATILSGSLIAANAGLILSEDFTYPDGGLITNSANTWINNSGTAGSLVNSNNVLIVSAARTEDAYHYLTGQPYFTNGPTTALFSSFTVKFSALPTLAGTYFAHFGGSNVFTTTAPPQFGGHRARLTAAVTNMITAGAAGVGKFCLYIQNSNNGIQTTNQWPTELDTNVTYTIVTRYVLSNTFSTVWINPSAQTDPSITDTNIMPYDLNVNGIGTNGPINMSAYCFRQATGESTNIFIDNLRVGTVFADVAGANTSPTISSIGNQSIAMSANTGPLSFTVGDLESPAGGLIVTASSANTTLVPNSPANLTLTGFGSASRTITVTPNSGQQGSSLITVNVSDTVNISSTTFTVTVGAPTISSIADVTAISNTVIPSVSFTVTDAESDAISFTKTSSNPTLIPTSGITVSGAGPTYSLALSPTPNQTGVSFITITANDGFNSSQTTFRLIVRPLLGLIYDENFLYTCFDQDHGLENATGGSGGPWKNVSPANAHFEMQVTNGWVYMVHTNNQDVGAAITGGPYDGTNGVTFYVSFPARWTFLPSAGGDYFFHLAASATDSSSFRGKIFASTTGAAAGKLRLGVSNTSNTQTNAPQDLSSNIVQAVVMRYNSGNGESVLWVNPTNELSPSVIATDSPGAGTVGGVALRQPGAAIGDIVIGHMKVGTSFSDVFSIAPESLQYQLAGGNLVLSWNNAFFTLTSSTSVVGPYTPVLGAASPYTNAITGDTMFFRLHYPGNNQ